MCSGPGLLTSGRARILSGRHPRGVGPLVTPSLRCGRVALRLGDRHAAVWVRRVMLMALGIAMTRWDSWLSMVVTRLSLCIP